MPLFWYFIHNGQKKTDADFFLFTVAGAIILTDFLDGFLARKLGQETPLGQYLDPVADKIAIVGCLWALSVYRGYPIWIVLFIIFREIASIWLGVFLFMKKDTLGKPNLWGKLGVFCVALSGIFYLMRWPYKESINFVLIFVLASGMISYGRKYWKTVFYKP